MYFFQSASAAAKSSCCSASSARNEYNSASEGADAINFESACRVSFGGRRTGTLPLGKRTVRKKTASSRLATSTFSAHLVSSPFSANVPADIRPSVSQTRVRVLGKYFNLHLPAPDVVREVFSGDSQPIAPGGERRGYCKLACVR